MCVGWNHYCYGKCTTVSTNMTNTISTNISNTVSVNSDYKKERYKMDSFSLHTVLLSIISILIIDSIC